MIAANFFGARLILIWEALLGRIPVVKSIYSSVKQVSDTLLSDSGQRVPQGAAGRVPAPGLLDDRVPDRHAGAGGRDAPAGRARQRLRADDAESDRRGYFLMVPSARVHELDMTVDEALKYIISMGVVAPQPRRAAPPGAPARSRADAPSSPNTRN